MKANLLYRRAVSRWGSKFQLEMAMEECLELSLAIRRHLRNPAKGKDGNIEEEIADVEIMMAQLRLIFNTKSISRIKAKKVRRLQRRLETW